MHNPKPYAQPCPNPMVMISITLLILSLSFFLQSSLTISWQLAACPSYNLLNHDVGRCENTPWKSIRFVFAPSGERHPGNLVNCVLWWSLDMPSGKIYFYHNFVNSLGYPQVSKLEYPEFSVSKLETILSR